ncbi:hypothetical protein ASE61_13530 [Bosea sp. Root670]|uniref:hypothetical protein n=1 Tax=Bosea sp. Root670 TaxID=1736583 RepID=UPI0007135E60|nr:hypothetical protein [Bosea sp. Root670]KRE03479.1 hypothetical protein ASE61_13530 [Bosea sp. Root670]
MPFEHVTTPAKPTPANDRGSPRIASIDEYESATERVRALADYSEGTPQADELAELVQAIMEWDLAHDDATSWH